MVVLRERSQISVVGSEASFLFPFGLLFLVVILHTFADIVAEIDPFLDLGRVLEVFILDKGALELLVEKIGAGGIFTPEVEEL